jgi:hypothetical protein
MEPTRSITVAELVARIEAERKADRSRKLRPEEAKTEVLPRFLWSRDS